VRDRRTLTSVLELLPGVGPARRKALLTHLGSAEAVSRATEAEIAAVPGIGAALAKRLHAALAEAAGDHAQEIMSDAHSGSASPPKTMAEAEEEGAWGEE
jgi:excinuclease ABC subunit C